MTGTITAQALPVLTSPLITRIYTPSDFGAFAIVFAISSILSILITGRYETCIILPRKTSNAYHIVLLSLIITIFSSLILFITVVISYDFLNSIAFFKKIEIIAYIIPFICLLNSVFQILYFWNNRNQSYRVMANSRVIAGMTLVFSQIILGLVLSPSGILLAFGLLISYFCSVAYLAFNFQRETKSVYNFDIIKCLSQGKRYINFPKYFLLAHTIEATTRQIPSLFLNAYFSASVAGYFLLVQRVIGSPISIIGGAIGDVFKQRASKAYHKDEQCTYLFQRTFVGLLSVSIIPFTALFLYAPSIFELVFGAEWREAGTYARIITPLYFLQFIASPLSSMYVIAEKQKEELVLQIIMFFSVLFIFLLNDNPFSVLIYYAAFYSFVYLFVVFRSYYFSRGLPC